jgi:hypothetical protein
MRVSESSSPVHHWSMNFINLLREKPCHFRARMDSAGRQSRPSLLQQANEVFSAAQYTGE